MWNKTGRFSVRDRQLVVVLWSIVIVLCLTLAGCTRSLTMRPGRDAYYQVTTQFVPAQASGSHSQQASLAASAPGDSIYQPRPCEAMKGSTSCGP